MADSPKHWCRIPQLENYIIDPQERREIAIPLYEGNDTYHSCLRYAVNWSEIVEIYPNFDNFTIDPLWPVESCLDGWEYNLTEIHSSIVIDFDLVCNKNIYPTLGLVGLNLGGPFGVYMFGVINDRCGRRISFFTCLTIGIVGNLLTAVAPNFWFWAVSRLIVGFTVPAVYQIPFIISLELVGPNYRSFVTVMTCLFYTFGLIILSGVTYMLRDWRVLSIATSAPFVLYYIYWCFLPESPRWLIARGQFKEALKILEKLARINKKDFPPSVKQKLKENISFLETKKEKHKMGPGIQALFKTPNMRLKTLLISLNWFANEMVYVGLSYYGPALGSNPYLSFLLSSLVEIPSYLLIWFVMDRWGRRWPLAVSMILSGILSIITVLLPSDAVLLILVLFLVSKFAISASFLIIYPFAGELFPTEVRGIGIGTAAYISGLGLAIIPFITHLGSESMVLPLVILGVISIIGGISSLRLPETLHHSLPQTVEEGEEFGKEWSIKDCCSCIPPRLEDSEAYDDLDKKTDIALLPTSSLSETTPITRQHRVPKLVKQASIMETPLDSYGSMKLTYWF
ncbi:carcinine transporter [Cimex lectularius]|uniref:Major facilitator superfamily (MFS) profile domain-containing protein n=1 Tax=Cimex lectularius TaxID=79782 RepID=A0A8I6TIC1_CIMLE|nr:carcinine transporter [Cimex lectularius]